MTHPDNLTSSDAARLAKILDRSPELAATAAHVRGFATMMTERQGHHPDEWIADVRADPLPALHSFASGLQRDHDAVLAGLTLPYSSGAVEGRVCILKFLKRIMYGRANFDKRHHRRSNYERRYWHPAADGIYPGKGGQRPWPSRPVLVDAFSWPGVPLRPAWAFAKAGASWSPPRGRGCTQHDQSGAPLASWLPIKKGIVPHGLRHVCCRGCGCGADHHRLLRDQRGKHLIRGRQLLGRGHPTMIDDQAIKIKMSQPGPKRRRSAAPCEWTRPLASVFFRKDYRVQIIVDPDAGIFRHLGGE